MTSIDCLKRLRRIDFFIQRKATGRPDDFAELLEVRKTTLYRNLVDLKNMGVPIVYDKRRLTYFYKEPFELVL